MGEVWGEIVRGKLIPDSSILTGREPSAPFAGCNVVDILEIHICFLRFPPHGLPYLTR
jgi:hypothetical protein